jgi:hypothetical protein
MTSSPVITLLHNQGARISVNRPALVTNVLRDFQESFNANACSSSTWKEGNTASFRVLSDTSFTNSSHYSTLNGICSCKTKFKKRKHQSINQSINQLEDKNNEHPISQNRNKHALSIVTQLTDIKLEFVSYKPCAAHYNVTFPSAQPRSCRSRTVREKNGAT